mgnify:CR=1 FL=1
MAELRRLESDDPRVAGILITFPGVQAVEITWTAKAPVQNTHKAAQSYATMLVDALKEGGMWHHVESTNWASMVAAIQKHLDEFNARLLKALTPAEGPSIH